jgi:uncharacterized spore protein YtfJ
VELEEIFEAIEDLRDKADVSAVYGEPVTVGDKTIIPVADIKYGFGFSFGEGPTEYDEEDDDDEPQGHAGGIMGGVAARPVAALEITDDGLLVRSVEDENKIALAGILTGAWAIFWLSKIIIAIFGKK